MQSLALNFWDDAIILGYFAIILLVGLGLRRRATNASEFFLAGRSLPMLVTGVAFVAANSGAVEVMGMLSTSAKYGTRAVHFYWIGAIPAMIFLALFMMPIYYRSRVRSVPEFLKVRFGEKTRTFNALSFAVLTILMSGISLYAMALILRLLLNWSFTTAVLLSSVIVLAYILMGGLTATIYNEVLQFGLIVIGFLPLAFFVIRQFHGWHGLAAALPGDLSHAWKGMRVFDPGTATVDGFGTVMGLGFVVSFSYWCTDFLLVQRALAARDNTAACGTPLVAAVAKLFFPALVVLPGVAAVALFPVALRSGYDLALPLLLAKYYPHGLLGLGITAILASFMSGMAGNISAFNTVWTYDLYQAHFAPNRSEIHYLKVGRWATVGATVLSIGTAFVALSFNSLMDYVQLLFAIFNAPLFATFLLGMFTSWATPKGAFAGLVSGTAASLLHYLLYRNGLIRYGSDMTANFYGAMVGWATCLAITILVSFWTRPVPVEQLKGLVYGLDGQGVLSGIPKARALAVAAGVILLAAAILNWIFF